ncbi:MAG: hypothetical protein JWQ81_7344 [Amycolatopsis sp.]|jgi:hypothetical protein|uniref:hypothetical protein n=1 Tax=Amycolatopsis sp. TaxID=37632 RepID=UPI00260CB542|nr:hypothetical protein [Amycolatopsis sp.]MCU1686605.1 hypothetical protein [Amycolatopsis sp.]
MQALFLGVAALACPVGMGAMMWMMMRGKNNTTAPADGQSQQQVDQLRTEIEALKAERATQSATGAH